MRVCSTIKKCLEFVPEWQVIPLGGELNEAHANRCARHTATRPHRAIRKMALIEIMKMDYQVVARAVLIGVGELPPFGGAAGCRSSDDRRPVRRARHAVWPCRAARGSGRFRP